MCRTPGSCISRREGGDRETPGPTEQLVHVGLGASSRHPLRTCGTTDLGRHQGSRALHSAPPTPVLYDPPTRPARGHHTGGVGAPGPAPESTCLGVSGPRPPTALATLCGLRGASVAAAVGHHPRIQQSCSVCLWILLILLCKSLSYFPGLAASARLSAGCSWSLPVTPTPVYPPSHLPSINTPFPII